MAALRGSWEPILASGGTVIAGLLMLLVSELTSNKILGPVAAIGIVFALLASLTLLPALMLWAGRAAFWPVRPEVRGARRSTTVGDGPPRHLAEGRPAHRAPSEGHVDRLDPAARRDGDRDDPAEGRWGAIERVRARRVAGPRRAGPAERALPGGSGTPAVVIAPEEQLDEVADVLLATEGVESVTVVSSDSPSGSLPVTEDGIQPLGPPGTPAGEPTVVDGRIQLDADPRRSE